jgi:hypothetical protein
VALEEASHPVKFLMLISFAPLPHTNSSLASLIAHYLIISRYIEYFISGPATSWLQSEEVKEVLFTENPGIYMIVINMLMGHTFLIVSFRWVQYFTKETKLQLGQ